MPRFEGGSADGGAGTVTGAAVAAVTVQNEVPAGAINGLNLVFTPAFAWIAGTLQVFLNGDLQEEGASNDYVEGVSTITFALAPKALDKVAVAYIKSP
jgi:hypothetical protein